MTNAHTAGHRDGCTVARAEGEPMVGE